MMRALALVFGLGLFTLVQRAPVRADTLDDNTRTDCRGDRCVGSYCDQDGDATNCWQESVYHRKPGELVHWLCTTHGHHCKWVSGPVPESDKWNVMQF
jgi:hypothetical protein